MYQRATQHVSGLLLASSTWTKAGQPGEAADESLRASLTACGVIAVEGDSGIGEAARAIDEGERSAAGAAAEAAAVGVAAAATTAPAVAPPAEVAVLIVSLDTLDEDCWTTGCAVTEDDAVVDAAVDAAAAADADGDLLPAAAWAAAGTGTAAAADATAGAVPAAEAGVVDATEAGAAPAAEDGAVAAIALLVFTLLISSPCTGGGAAGDASPAFSKPGGIFNLLT